MVPPHLPFVIGVIDLLNGEAVHARGGDRRTYRPVAVPGSGHPGALAQFYRNTAGVDQLYVADLNAIAGGDWQSEQIREIGAQTGGLWLDAGIRSVSDAARARSLGASRIVVGLETLPGLDALRDICAGVEGARVALSLDLRDGRLVTDGVGVARDTPPHAVAAQAAALGVRTIIVLDLSRVGLAGGCDLDTIAAVRTAAPQVTLLAGGGIRDADDLRRIAAIGCDGALVATALLNGALQPADVRGSVIRS